VQDAYEQSKCFFKKELSFKMESFRPELAGQRGFVPGESAKAAKSKDYKEFYHVGRNGAAVGNVWPNQPGFEDAISFIFQELERYVVPLQEAIVAAINLHAEEKMPLSCLNEMTKNGESLLRALYYPAVSKEGLEDPLNPHCWAAAHTDIDLISILPYATEKGLQVEVNGEWLNVVVPPDSFIVNVGDMLQNLTNGLFVSSKHRVVAQEPNKERFSMAFFVHPKDDTALDPFFSCIKQTGGVQLYAPGNRREFLWERLLELGLAPGLLEPYYNTGHMERQLQYNRASPQVLEMFREKGFTLSQ
jgi:isopenicillin N synthase-like dioxygenase